MSSIGKVASPPRKESTSEEFFFWIKPDTLIEKTQIVKTKSVIGLHEVTFYGLVTEVFRQSRQSDMGEEIDRYDGDVSYEPPFDSPGFNYAQVTILRTVPAVRTGRRPPSTNPSTYPRTGRSRATNGLLRQYVPKRAP